jgi:hypothetical protein
MKFAIFLALAVSYLPLWAQEAAPAPNIPVVTQVPGQPVKAVWSDGREAELKFSRSVLSTVGVDYQVTENLCAPRNGDIVRVIFPYRADFIGWFWSKHSDSAKVGQVVKMNFQNRVIDLVRLSIVTNAYRHGHPDLIAGMPNDEVHFTSLEWLPGFENGILKPFTVSAWLSESMVTNSQTGISENRIYGGAYNVQIKPTADQKAEITGADSYFIMPSDQLSFLLVGDVVIWQWQNAQGPCNIAFKPNLGPAIAEVTRFLGTLNGPFNPFLHEQDSLLGTVEPEFVKEDLYYAE